MQTHAMSVPSYRNHLRIKCTQLGNPVYKPDLFRLTLGVALPRGIDRQFRRQLETTTVR